MNIQFHGWRVALLALLAITNGAACASGDSQAMPPASAESAGTPAQVPSPEAQPAAAPRIKIDRTLQDFGDIIEGSVQTTSFQFTNAGTGVLRISSVKPSCECTVPELLGEKMEYAPGESGILNVILNAPKRKGAVTQSVCISSNDATSPETIVHLRAEIPLEVRATPGTIHLTLADQSRPEIALETPITITSVDHQPFAVTGVVSRGDVFAVDFDPHHVAETHTFHVKVKTENLRRQPNGDLVFEVSHPLCKSARLDYECVPELQITPSVVIVRNAVDGQPQRQTLSLVNNYRQPLEIESVSSGNGIAKVVERKPTEHGWELEVEMVPPPREGKRRVFSDELHVKIKGHEQVSVPCRGFYKVGADSSSS